MAARLLSVVPTLRVADAERSRRFYCHGLGFTEDWAYRADEGLPWFLSLSRDGLTLFLTEHTECVAGALVYVYVQDVDGLYEQLGQRHIPVQQAPAVKPWNTREMQVLDPDGNALRFGQVIG